MKSSQLHLLGQRILKCSAVHSIYNWQNCNDSGYLPKLHAKTQNLWSRKV